MSVRANEAVRESSRDDNAGRGRIYRYLDLVYKDTEGDCFAFVLQQFRSESGGGTEVPLREGKKEGEARSACGNALLLPSSRPPFVRY